MSKKTIQERLIVALTALGMKEVGSKFGRLLDVVMMQKIFQE